MMRALVSVVATLVAAGAVSPAAAQKVPPTTTRPPAAAPAGTQGPKVLRPTPSAAPTAQPAVPVTPQAAQPAPAAVPTHSAGLAMPAYTGSGTEAALAYAGRFAHMLDSTIVMLVGVFRNTSGQPVIGARSPETLSQRERERWTRCRDLYWDLTTYATATGTLEPALPSSPEVQLKAAQLDSAFRRNTATAECDNISSMIAAPDRFEPWQASYETSARRFYRDFYPQVRRIHEAARALIFALNAQSPGRALAMPPGLPQNPPYAGAAPN